VRGYWIASVISGVHYEAGEDGDPFHDHQAHGQEPYRPANKSRTIDYRQYIGSLRDK
jgi:hypothetical protein